MRSRISSKVIFAAAYWYDTSIAPTSTRTYTGFLSRQEECTRMYQYVHYWGEHNLTAVELGGGHRVCFYIILRGTPGKFCSGITRSVTIYHTCTGIVYRINIGVFGDPIRSDPINIGLLIGYRVFRLAQILVAISNTTRSKRTRTHVLI